MAHAVTLAYTISDMCDLLQTIMARRNRILRCQSEPQYHDRCNMTLPLMHPAFDSQISAKPNLKYQMY
jgi:hypothetical protein